MRVPLTILTGFLGAGKTTLLRELLHARDEERAKERIAVLVNEAGPLALDHHLLERVDDDTVVLGSGCVCCTLRGDVLLALERLLALEPARMVLETTGLADPAPLIHAVTHDPVLSSRIFVEQVVCVLDASRAAHLFDEQPEARLQLAVADKVIITKRDLAATPIEDVNERLAKEAPAADVHLAEHGVCASDWLSAAPKSGLLRAGAASRWLFTKDDGHQRQPAHAVESRVIELPSPADEDALWLWLRLVTQLDGRGLLRIKGLVESRARGDVCVLESAQHAVFPLRRLKARPAGFDGSALVVLARGMSASVLDRLSDSAREAASGARRSEARC